MKHANSPTLRAEFGLQAMPRRPARPQKRAQVRTGLLQKDRATLRKSIILNFFQRRSYRKVARLLGVHPFKVSYWVKKFRDPTFHSNPHGGVRSVTKFPEHQNDNLMKLVMFLLFEKPTLNLNQLRVEMMRRLGYSFSKSVLSKFLRKNHWTWRIPTRIQLHKYSIANKKNYAHYISSIMQVPVEKIKYMDEAHVVERQINKRKVCLVLMSLKICLTVRCLV